MVFLITLLCYVQTATFPWFVFGVVLVALILTLFINNSKRYERRQLYRLYKKLGDCTFETKKINLEDVTNKYVISCLTGGILGNRNAARDIKNLIEVCRRKTDTSKTAGMVFAKLEPATTEDAVTVALVKKGLTTYFFDYVSEEINTNIKKHKEKENFTIPTGTVKEGNEVAK